MKKILTSLLLILFFAKPALAEIYYFKACKLSETVLGTYVIDIDKKRIYVTLASKEGKVQKFSDKIKIINKDQIISEKIKSGVGDDIYFEYYLNSKTKKVTKLQYKKQSGPDIDVFRIQSKKESACLEVKGGWDKKKIEQAAIDKEQKEITKAQKKLKKEQEDSIKCVGNNYKKWTNCKGSYKSETGHTYNGIFKDGKIGNGVAFFPGGAKYVGEFKNYKPHGFGNFFWANGDKYFGDWIDGKSDGNGTKIWSNGREYTGTFKNDKPHGSGVFYYADGTQYDGQFLNGKRHGEGTFAYPDGTAFIGKFISGKQQGLGVCVSIDGSSLPCENRTETKAKDFSGKDTRKISIVAKKWIRISQYETNTKKGKKVMDKLKANFDDKAKELCLPKIKHNVLEKKIEVLDLDETPAYGLETKLQVGISGVVECI